MRLPHVCGLVVTAMLLAVGAAPAAHAAGTQIGAGENPAVAIDTDGMAHVVWNESRPGEVDVLHYCRIPAGEPGCADEQLLEPFPDESPNFDVAGPQVMVTGAGDVILLTHRVGVSVEGSFPNLVYTSAEHGAPGTFSDPTPIGTNAPGGRPAVYDAGEGMVVTVSASRTGGTFVQGAPIEGGFTTDEARLSEGEKAYDGTVVQRGPGSYAAAYADFDNVYLRTFTCDGAGCARDQINDPTEWTAEITVSRAQEPRLASGPSGTFLMYRTRPEDPGPTQWMVRQVVGGGVSGPAPVSAPGAEGVDRDLVSDETGLLHAVFLDENVALVHRSSSDGGDWSAPDILQPGPDFRTGDPRVAVSNRLGGFNGFAVWTAFDGADNSPILIAPIPPPRPPDPGPDPGGPPPGPPGGAPRNVVAPEIRPGPSAGLYLCDDGEWEDVGPAPEYEYFWLYSPTNDSSSLFTPVGSDPGYVVTREQAGGWFYCAVRITNEHGTSGALSNTVKLGTKGYGDLHVRGIDVFQTVQPSACADMYGVPPGPWGQDVEFGERLPATAFRPLDGFNYAGGGTPTAYRSTRLGCVEVGPAPGADPQRVPYDGVTLDADKPATAIVYLAMAAKGAGYDVNQDVEVSLSFLIRGRRFATVVQKVKAPPDARRPFVTTMERDNPGSGGIPFEVPSFVMFAARESDDLSVEARVNFPLTDIAYECDPPTRCDQNNRFRLDGIPVLGVPNLLVETLAITGRPPATSQSTGFPESGKVLEKARQLYPGGERMYVLPYAAWLDLGFEMNLSLADHECTDLEFKTPRSCRTFYVSDRILRWSVENGLRTDYDLLLAIHDYLTDNPPTGVIEPGWTLGARPGLEAYASGSSGQPVFTANAGSAKRPLTAAAHELGHVLTAPHAGQSCDDTRVGDPQEGEPWSPDDRGRLWSVKFDRTRVGDNRTTVDKSTGGLSDGLDIGSTELYDLMSYCAAESNAWLSARNWNRAFQTLLDFGQRPARTRAAAPPRAVAAQAGAAGRRLVTGVMGPDGQARILSVSPSDRGHRTIPSDPASPIRLRALDAGGGVLAEVGAQRLQATSVTEGAVTFHASLPAAAASVQVVRDGQVLDSRARSARPRVRVLAPRRGALVRARGSLPVRWSAADPDGDPLRASVEYSTDGGRSWHGVYDGESRGRVSIPGRLLAGSRRARVRVRVNDGFDEARAVSPLFRSEGRPPVARIARPVRRETAQAGMRTTLVGTGIDDRNRPLGPRSLTWFAGRRRLGKGERISARLPAGRVRVRLVARDRNGRRGVDAVRLRVEPITLRVTTLRVPPSVERGARRVAVRLATSGPAQLRAGGRRLRVTKRARRVVLPLPRRPVSGQLQIPIELRGRGPAKGGRLRATLIVVRS